MKRIRISVLLLTLSLVSAVASAESPEQIRKDFHALIDRPKVDPKPEIKVEDADGLHVEKGSFASEAKERVPFVLVRKADATGKLPAVILLHGTGQNKERMRSRADELAKRGYLAIAIDGRYFGERAKGGEDGVGAYDAAIIRAWHTKPGEPTEHPFFYDTVWDVWRTIDYLESRPDVDAKRIGLLGVSKGGIEGWMAAATDERIRCVVPAISVQSMKWSLENDQWQGRANTIRRAHAAAAKDLGEPEVNQRVCRELWAKVTPHITDEFDCPSMLPAIAPRPMLILNGENDPNNPLPGAKIAHEAAKKAYAAANAPDKLEIDIALGVGHTVTPAQFTMAYAFLDKWLK